MSSVCKLLYFGVNISYQAAVFLPLGADVNNYRIHNSTPTNTIIPVQKTSQLKSNKLGAQSLEVWLIEYQGE